jgi:hypothetical protein
MRVFPALMRRSGALASGLAAASAVAGALMFAATFATVARVDVAGGSCEVINDTNPSLAAHCKLSGFERHGPALALLGGLAVAMGLGSSVGGSRPAAVGLAAAGATTLILALASDLPKTRETGAIGQSFAGARAAPGPGLYLELAGGALALATAAAALARPVPPQPRPYGLSLRPPVR